MGLFSWLSNLYNNHSYNDNSSNSTPSFDSSIDDNAINPANGLPMVGGTGGVDVEGNPYGFDSSHDDTIIGSDDLFSSGSSFDDSFLNTDNSYSGYDDSFSSGSGFDD